jgi:hypothetical protein
MNAEREPGAMGGERNRELDNVDTSIKAVQPRRAPMADDRERPQYQEAKRSLKIERVRCGGAAVDAGAGWCQPSLLDRRSQLGARHPSGVSVANWLNCGQSAHQGRRATASQGGLVATGIVDP